MTKQIIIAIAILFFGATGIAQDEKNVSPYADGGAFYANMIIANETEFCSIYGSALRGYISHPELSLDNDTAIGIVKEIAIDRKIKINIKNFKKNKAGIGDSKCHFFAVMGFNIGQPSQVNTTVIKGRKIEQYIMKHSYLYFENDKFTGYQTSQ